MTQKRRRFVGSYPVQELSTAYDEVVEMHSALAHMIEHTFYKNDGLFPQDFGRGLSLLIEAISDRHVNGIGPIVDALDVKELTLDFAPDEKAARDAENLRNGFDPNVSQVRFATT